MKTKKNRALCFVFTALSLVSQCLFAQDELDWHPLLDRHFSELDQAAAANGLKSIDYMSSEERKVIAYTNLARLFPQQFDAFYLDWLENEDEDEGWEKYNAGDYFYTTLHKDLQKMKSLPALVPSKKWYKAATQWAKYSGKNGLEGHHRPWYMRRIEAECCDYNPVNDAMTMVLDLLIDEKVKSLGHRKILLGKYKFAGASIQPHAQYGWCLVVDLGE